ncbi:iron-containing alcohol dehydrogenase [Bacillus alveayuensis]|uniref:iron-containing alcohol dehydrogenase n=1 Tax=Aeribacillus alveayuensis TaxID=279215 RepID=UPI0005CD3CAA|nr:iron-containing alcohol dehydrogenase [Bacillus alveayuensis]
MYQFVSPIKIITGEGSIVKIKDIIEDLNAKRVMIFADPVIVNIGQTKKIESILDEKKIDYKIYTEISPEPPLEVGDKAVQAVKEFQADLLIGIGGGSCLDITKASSVLANHEGNVKDYLNLYGTKSITEKGIPKILIPTTAGTGAEVTDIAVFSLKDTKDVITHEHLLADIAIIDPELTYTLPPKVTASSGIDAFTHAIEAYTSVNATELTDVLAQEAMRKINGHIRTAVWHGANKEARKEMAWGSLIAGLSFYNAGVAGVHALAYPLGGLFKIPHGESNAVLLPYVYDYIWPACLPKMKKIAEVLQLPTENKHDREIALSVVQYLHDLVKDTGLPTSLKEYGIQEKDIEILAQNGIEQKRLLSRSPRPFTLDAVKSIYQAAYEGKLALGQ